MRIPLRWYAPAATALTLGVAASMNAFASAPSVRDQIVKAARAPYEALAHRDTSAFCDAFTPAAAAHVVAGAPPTATCVTAVAELFAKAAAGDRAVRVIPPAGWRVTDVLWRDEYASASVRYGQQSVASLVLRKVGHRWLVTSRMRLVPISGCRTQSARAAGCPGSAYVAIALIESPSPGQVPALPPVPPDVRRAGGQELSEFKRGRLVFAQSGCEACHRLGVQGNPGPGPDLSHIGSTLSTRQIDYAIAEPTQPMPSFKHLPRAKFHALVTFLSLLR